ncbi:MAG: Uncharacterized protein AUK63_1058 [bacterium P3]|nr:MAG: Uncharacterized protein AUK63_1058 [bacterium P3]KWW40751.1 MAG: Uncharacterized protein F083_1406 [bacterium F083]
MENCTWKSTTKQIYTGVMLYSLCGIVSGLVAILAFLSGGFWSVLSVILSIAIIVGYVLYFIGLRNFKNVVMEPDAPVVNKLYTAVILVIIGYIVGFIPVAGGIIQAILNIIAFIMMMVAYNKLRKSTTFPGLARKGASMLFTAMILSLIGAVISIIPLVGTIIAAILNIISFIMVLLGWKKIADDDLASSTPAVE